MLAIIFAGGFGNRLGNVVKFTPKPMLDVGGRPFLCKLLDQIKDSSVLDVYISVYYLADKIIDYFGCYYKGLNIHYVIDPEPLGTGGALLNSLKQIKSETIMPRSILVMNGDCDMDIDYVDFTNSHFLNNCNMSMAVKYLNYSGRFGLVEVNDAGFITKFSSKSRGSSGLINAGRYIINPYILDNYSLGRKFSLEHDFLEKYAKDLMIKPYEIKGDFIDIGTPEDYRKICEAVEFIA